MGLTCNSQPKIPSDLTGKGPIKRTKKEIREQKMEDMAYHEARRIKILHSNGII